MTYKLPTEREARGLIHSAHRIFAEEKNIIYINGNISVIADVDGNLLDLIRVIDDERKLISPTFLFLGDLLSRGEQCLAMLLYILHMKVSNPSDVYMVKDARFAALASGSCNMKLNCIETYSDRLYDELVKCLDSLPLAAVLNKSIYATHGGVPCYRNDNKVYLGPTDEPDYIASVEDLQKMNRELSATIIKEITGCLTRRKSKESERVLSYSFSKNVASEFLTANGLKTILGCHEFWENFTKVLNDGSVTTVVKTIYTEPVVDGAAVASTMVYRVFGDREKDVIYEMTDKVVVKPVDDSENEFILYRMPDKPHEYTLPEGKSIFDVVVPMLLAGVVELEGYFNMLKQRVVVEQVKSDMQTRFGAPAETKIASPNFAKEIFELLDSSSSGILTIDDFLKLWVRNEYLPILNLLIQAFHSKPGMKLDQREFSELYDCVVSDDRSLRTKLFFKSFDLDKDDKISGDDLVQVLTMIDSDELISVPVKSAYRISSQMVKKFGSHFGLSAGLIGRSEFRKAIKDVHF